MSKPLIRLEVCINIFLNKVHGMKNSVRILLKSFLHGQYENFFFLFSAWHFIPLLKTVEMSLCFLI